MEDSNEFQIPDASTTCDIQPYMFEPTDDQNGASSENETSSEEEEMQARGPATQRLHDTEWYDVFNNLAYNKKYNNYNIISRLLHFHFSRSSHD